MTEQKIKEITVDLEEFMDGLNGDEGFTSIKMALGFIKEDERIFISKNMVKTFLTKEVGKAVLSTAHSAEFILTNSARLIMSGMDPLTAKKAALIRLQLIMKGLLLEQKIRGEMDDEVCIYEEDTIGIQIVNKKLNYSKSIYSDEIVSGLFVKMSKNLKKLSKMVALPIAFSVAIMFYKRAHHVVDDRDFLDSLNRIFAASVPSKEIRDHFPVGLSLFRTAIHPFGIKAFWNFMKKTDYSINIPRAITLRMTSAPAGTSLIFASVAAIAQFKTFNLFSNLIKYHGKDIIKLAETAQSIRESAVKYHVMAQMFTNVKVSPTERKNFEISMKIGERFAPMLKAFVTVLLKKTSLAKIRVFDKFVDSKAANFIRFKYAFKKVEAETKQNINYVNCVSENRKANMSFIDLYVGDDIKDNKEINEKIKKNNDKVMDLLQEMYGFTNQEDILKMKMEAIEEDRMEKKRKDIVGEEKLRRIVKSVKGSKDSDIIGGKKKNERSVTLDDSDGSDTDQDF